MGNIVRREGDPQIVLHTPDQSIPPDIPEAIDTSTEYYEIRECVTDGQGFIPTVWFQPRTDTAIIKGLGDDPDMVVPDELMSYIHGLCRPKTEPAEMWMVNALLSGCFTSGHETLYAFDEDGDQYTICSRCGKLSFTGFVADDDDDLPYERPFFKEEFMPTEACQRPEDLPERTAYFHAGIPIIDHQGNVIGTLLVYPVEYDDTTGIAFAADEFEEASCRVTVVISLEDVFTVISRMALESAQFTLSALEEPEADEYFDLLDLAEWPFVIEWGTLSLNRKVTLTYPVTTEYEDDEGHSYEVQVDKALFFIGLMAVRQAVESKHRLSGEQQII